MNRTGKENTDELGVILAEISRITERISLNLRLLAEIKGGDKNEQ